MSWLQAPSTNWLPYELLAACVLIAVCALTLIAVFRALLDISRQLDVLSGAIMTGFYNTNGRLSKLTDLDEHLSSIEAHVESLREAQDARELENDLRG